MELLILSPKEELLSTIEDSELQSAKQREVLNNEHTFNFIVNGETDKSTHVKEGNLVAFEDIEGDFQLYEIIMVTDIHGDGSTKEALCEHASKELWDDHIEDVRPQDKTAEYALTQALAGTRWQVGTVGQLGNNSTNFYRESPRSAIKKIIEVWGGESRYRITFNGNKITGRFVDLLARRGADRGKTYEHGKDLVEITRTVDSSSVKTAVRGYGKGEASGDGYGRRLTFSEVVWSKANGDPVDKPKGQDWIGDENSRLLWGRPSTEGVMRHRFGQFDDGEETDSTKLLKKAYDYLLTVNKPVFNYEGKVVDLFRLKGDDYIHERAILGDTAAVLDHDIVPAIEEKARIIELTRDLLNPSEDEAVLGQYLPLYDDKIDKIIDQVNEKSPIWENPVVDPSKYPNIKPSKPVVEANGSFETVQLFWKYTYGEYYTQAFEVYASEVKGFTTNPESMIFSGLVNGYNFVGETNKQYYFRVRAINYQGVASDFSDEVTATTARIINDDILFGPEIAASLRELSKSAQLIASGSVGIDILKEGALAGDVFLTDGKTYIADAAVGEAAIENAAINRLHLQQGIVGTLQIEDAAITNAKIKSVSADKLTFGTAKGITLEAVTIKGSVFQSEAVDSTMWIEGGDIRLTETRNGRNLNLNALGMTGFNNTGDILFQATKTWVTSAIFGTNTKNVYLAAGETANDVSGEARVVHIRGIPGDGEVSSYTYLPLRASGFKGNFLDVNSGTAGINLYLRPLKDGEVRVTAAGTTDIYYPLRAASIFGTAFVTTTTNAYIGTDNELRVVSKGAATESDIAPVYRNVKANGYFGQFLTADPDFFAYIGTDLGLRVTSRGLAGAGPIYRDVIAAGFTNGSRIESKTDIELWTEDALEIIKNSDITTYYLKGDLEQGRTIRKYGLVIGGDWRTPEHIINGDGVDQYSMESTTWRAMQQVIARLEAAEEKIAKLESV